MPGDLPGVPVHPLLLDTAQTYLHLPNLEHKMPKQSAFSRFFGWGGAS